MRDRSRPPPPLLVVAAQVPLPPSPKPFARFFNSSNRSRTPQDVPLTPSPMRPSFALSTSSNEHSRYTSVDSPSAEPGSRWSPYSTPSAPKSNPFAALRRSLNLSSASVGSSTNSTRRSSSILTLSAGRIHAQEIVCPNPPLRLHVDTQPSDPLPRPPSPLPPSSFNFLKRVDPPTSPSPFTSVLDISSSAGSPPPTRRPRKNFWPSRVSGGSRHAEQGAAPNKLGEKLSQFVEDTKRKLGRSRRGERKSVEATRPARELDARDDKLLKAALWTLFGDSSSALETGEESAGGDDMVNTLGCKAEETASSPTSARLFRRRNLSPFSPSRGLHTTPAPPHRRGRTRTPKLPRVSFGASFEVDAPFLIFGEGEENDTSGEETPKASRMVRKVMSVEELGRERDGDETPTHHRTPRHSVSTPALRTPTTSTSKSKIKSLLVLEDAPVLTSTAEETSNSTYSISFDSTSPIDQQHRDGEKEEERREARNTTTSFRDLTNTIPHSNGPSSSSHSKTRSIFNSYNRSQVRCHSPLAQSHFPDEENDVLPPLRFSQQRPTLDSVRYSFASEEGDGMEALQGQWVDESEEGSEDDESQPRHSVESSATFGNRKQVKFSDSHGSSTSDQELSAETADLSSSTELPSLPLTRPPSYPPPPPPRTAKHSSEWLSYAEAEEVAEDQEEKDDFGDHSSPSNPTALSRALQTPLPRSSSTDSLNSLETDADDSPTSPPLPPVDRRRSHPIPYTSSRSLSSLNSLESEFFTSDQSFSPQQTPRPSKSSRSLPPFLSSSPTRPTAPNSTPTAVVRCKDASTHPLLSGTFLLTTKLAAAAGVGRGKEGEGQARD